MDPTELTALIARNEADRIEFTVSTDDTDKFSEAVCAFANDLPNHRLPGHLIIGVDGKKLLPAGLTISDELLRNLAGLRDNGNIQPLPSIVVEKVSLPTGEVAVVTVHPSLLPPVRYRGRVCIRLGPRRAYASEQEERMLIERRVAHARTFDAQPCLGAALADISQPLFIIDYRQQVIAQEIIDENHRSVEDQLASLRFFDLDRGCPTNAGILLFGLDVRRWLPGAYVQILTVDGLSLAGTILNEHEVVGDLMTILRELDAIIDAELRRAPVQNSLLREQTSADYPRVAVRELVMNAIMHRNYESTAPTRITFLDDRVEIQSPGNLYGEANPANFPRQTSYRNPIVAEAMKALGYVNRYGRGVIRAQEALVRNGSREATFGFDAGFVLATIWKHS